MSKLIPGHQQWVSKHITCQFAHKKYGMSGQMVDHTISLPSSRTKRKSTYHSMSSSYHLAALVNKCEETWWIFMWAKYRSKLMGHPSGKPGGMGQGGNHLRSNGNTFLKKQHHMVGTASWMGGSPDIDKSTRNRFRAAWSPENLVHYLLDFLVYLFLRTWQRKWTQNACQYKEKCWLEGETPVFDHNLETSTDVDEFLGLTWTIIQFVQHHPFGPLICHLLVKVLLLPECHTICYLSPSKCCNSTTSFFALSFEPYPMPSKALAIIPLIPMLWDGLPVKLWQLPGTSSFWASSNPSAGPFPFTTSKNAHWNVALAPSSATLSIIPCLAPLLQKLFCMLNVHELRVSGPWIFWLERSLFELYAWLCWKFKVTRQNLKDLI